MTRLPDRFIEDRTLRDAARAVLAEDIERLRATLGEEGIASRVSSGLSSTISGRIKSGAGDLLAQARDQAGNHKGMLALLIGAIILFFAREPILEWFETPGADNDENDAGAEPETALQGDPG